MAEETEQWSQGSDGPHPTLAQNSPPGALSYRRVSGCPLAVCQMEDK